MQRSKAQEFRKLAREFSQHQTDDQNRINWVALHISQLFLDQREDKRKDESKQ